MEMVQRRAARFVYNDWCQDSSPTSMIHRLKWDSLEERRQIRRLLFLHKFVHKEIDLKDDIMMKSRGENSTFRCINPRIRSYANSFIPTTIRDWNVLPETVRNEPNAATFKSKITEHIKR